MIEGIDCSHSLDQRGTSMRGRGLDDKGLCDMGNSLLMVA